MLIIETKELNISEELRKKVDMICKFAYVKPTYKKGNLRLGVITIDLSNVIAPNGKQVYKEYFDKVREVLKDNELCNI